MEPRPTTNVGYIDERGAVYCTACWRERVAGGAHPSQILDADDDGTIDNFWIVDPCGECSREVRYRSVKVLD